MSNRLHERAQREHDRQTLRDAEEAKAAADKKALAEADEVTKAGMSLFRNTVRPADYAKAKTQRSGWGIA